jgi:translocation and assembly module TamA
VEGERFFVNSSVLDGDFWQLSLPVFFIYNGSNDLLNPTTGFQVKLQETPSFVLSPELRSYLSNELTVCYYLPLTNSHAVTLAQKLFAGAILCKGDQTVPVPYRFFGGSEEDLRGYAYYSVSPLNQENKPIGGRSAVYYTLETRFRMTKTVGVVPFFDLGRVTKHQLPSLQGKWLKSVGLGLRYFSFMGPFRLDVGFPLNPRKGLDKNYRLLVSIGQTF